MADDTPTPHKPEPLKKVAPDQSSLVDLVEDLADALKDSDVSELDLEEGGTRILIRRQLDPVVVAPRVIAMGPSAVAPAEPVAPQEHTVAVIAPLTGIFYSSASPNVPPFVEVGDSVQAGAVVCIVEAMKVFNEIKSEASGMVTEFVAQNGQLVQKGQALIRLRPV
ncbi:MAG TPA: acetyl-CoA carboxylase biotin carboxyl carrier protein subunit [Ktedonobacterales bacterium]